MFWFSETNARRGADWRREVHDSDGPAIGTGAVERLGRALENPPRLQYSGFKDNNPRGYGLRQRGRVFDHYQDARVRFERRLCCALTRHDATITETWLYSYFAQPLPADRQASPSASVDLSEPPRPRNSRATD